MEATAHGVVHLVEVGPGGDHDAAGVEVRLGRDRAERLTEVQLRPGGVTLGEGLGCAEGVLHEQHLLAPAWQGCGLRKLWTYAHIGRGGGRGRNRIEAQWASGSGRIDF